VEAIGQKTSKWTAMDTSINPMSKIPAHLVKSSLGLTEENSGFLKHIFVRTAPSEQPLPRIFDVIKGDPSLPDYYNVREEYPECEPKILD
jgi:hypothetical protein